MTESSNDSFPSTSISEININNTNEVAEHYNKRQATDLATRSMSRIYYLRNFNNYIKSVLIQEFMTKLKTENNIWKPAVLDLGCGKGGDIPKWRRSYCSRVTFADVAEKSLEECRRRLGFGTTAYQRNKFKSSFVHIDLTTESIEEKLVEHNELKHDLISCQFVIHYSFESFRKANNFLKNVSDSLKPNCYFIGTTTNDYEIVKRLRESDTNEFGNELYKIKFQEEQDKESISSLFGVKFDFQLGFETDEVVNVPEYLLNFDVLTQLAARYNLKLLFKKTFKEFFLENSQRKEYNFLINIIKALEPVYSKNNEIITEEESDQKLKSDEYEAIRSKLENDEQFKNELESDETYLTISKSEWEAINLYIVYAFVKIEDQQNEETDNVKQSDEEVKKENASETVNDNEVKDESD